jgi:DNA-binding SARP family transcriptional activator/tetratricopeptide (TPR) repeat protein
VEVDTAKAIALLAYLVLNETRQRRETLVGLLWPESDQVHGRAALRRTLSTLNKALGGGSLLADRDTVGLDPGARLWVDILQYRARLAACKTHGHETTAVCPDCLAPLGDAVALCGGDFLQGFSLRDSLAFDDWQYHQGELLRRELDGALERLASGRAAGGEVEAALDAARRRTAVDPLNEAAHCQLMELYARAGQRPSALRQYGECARILQAELGVTPQRTTTSLYQQIAAGRIGPEQAATPVAEAPSLPPGSLAVPAEAAPEPSPETRRIVTVLFADVSARREPVGHGVPGEAAPRGFETPGVVLRPTNVQAKTGVTPARPAVRPGRADRPRASSAEAASAVNAGIPAPAAGELPSPDEIAATLGEFARAAGDILARHGGELLSLAGGGLVAVFGAAGAHEHDPERALRAALEMRAAAGRLGLNLSAALSTGEALLVKVGAEGSSSTALLGAPADAARRLSASAAAGEILASEPTYRLAARSFEFARLDREPEAGTAYRVEHSPLERERDAARDGFTAELIGREAELARLESALAGLRSGQGGMVSIIGEAGVGKSRLIRELRALTAGSSHGEERSLWLEGRCLEMDTLAGYAPFIDMFQAHFGFRAGEPDRNGCNRICSGLAEMVGGGVLSEERCEEVAPLLCRLLSLHGDGEQLISFPKYTAEVLRQKTFLAVQDVLVALARRRPVILVFEDLHWADGLSLDLISLLMEALRESPLLLVCAYRSDPGHRSAHLGAIASRKCRDQYTELRLSELSHEQSAQMVASLLRTASLPLSARELILERCQGNPFFIEEVVQALLESGLLYEAGGVWRTRERLDRSAVPGTIQQVILGRMDRLDEGLRRLLQTASVIGRVFRRRVLESVATEPPEKAWGQASLEQDLWVLEDRGLIYEERAVPELEYSFRHVLVQEAMLQSLPGPQRAALHGRVVAAMEALYGDNPAEHCEELAHHAVASGDASKAVPYLLQAGEKAKRAYDNAAAIDHFTRALDLLRSLSPGPERDRRELELQLALGTPLVHTRGHSAAEVAAAYARADGLSRDAGDALSRFHALLGLRRYHLHRAELGKALETDEQLLSLAREISDPTYLARAHAMRGETLLRAGEFASAREHAALASEPLLTAAQRLDQALLFGNDNATLGGAVFAQLSWYLGHPDSALEQIRQVLADARQAGHPFSLVVALYWSVTIHRLRRETLAGRVIAQALLEVAQAHAFPLFAAVGAVEDGWALAASDPRAGIERIRDGIALCEAADLNAPWTGAHAALAEAFGRAGDPGAGLSAIAEGITLVEETGERQWEAELYRLQGELLALVGEDTGQVEASFQRALQVSRRQQARSLELRAAVGLARYWQRLGRPGPARQLLQPLYAWFTEGFDTADLVDARALLEALF